MHRDFDSSAATSERMEQLIRPQQRFKQLRIGTLSEHRAAATAGRHFLKVAEHQMLNTMLGTATGSQASNSSRA